MGGVADKYQVWRGEGRDGERAMKASFNQGQTQDCGWFYLIMLCQDVYSEMKSVDQ